MMIDPNKTCDRTPVIDPQIAAAWRQGRVLTDPDVAVLLDALTSRQGRRAREIAAATSGRVTLDTRPLTPETTIVAWANVRHESKAFGDQLQDFLFGRDVERTFRGDYLASAIAKVSTPADGRIQLEAILSFEGMRGRSDVVTIHHATGVLLAEGRLDRPLVFDEGNINTVRLEIGVDDLNPAVRRGAERMLGVAPP